ncbi:hypothetical protein Tco_0237051 [Tanacetum coccineum]
MELDQKIDHQSDQERYSQWESRFLSDIDTKPNVADWKKSILSGPYVPTRYKSIVEAAKSEKEAISALNVNGDETTQTVDGGASTQQMKCG